MYTARTRSWCWKEEESKFDWGDSEARIEAWGEREALYLWKGNSVVFLKEELPFQAYRMKADVAIPGQVGFIGLVFGVRDPANYELIYLAPVEIQYDPIMNGSMTWQIYHGPFYQKPLPNMTGRWRTFIVEVYPDHALAFIEDQPEDKLLIRKLQHGVSNGRIGFWNFLPSYIANLTVEELPCLREGDAECSVSNLPSGAIIHWMVSKPYRLEEGLVEGKDWMAVQVEENGTLNLNRLYAAEMGVSVQAKGRLEIPHEAEGMLSLGFSDQIRLWVNEEVVYENQRGWTWNPPESDGRIRSDAVHVPVRWKAGENTIRAEVTNTEGFGWGLHVKAEILTPRR